MLHNVFVGSCKVQDCILVYFVLNFVILV